MQYSKIKVQPLSNDRWLLLRDFFNNGVVVPKGFKTNGADIPRIFWSIYPPNRSDYFPATLVHDFMCQAAGDNYEKHKNADTILLKNMLQLGVNRTTSYIFYYACSLSTFIKYKYFGS